VFAVSTWNRWSAPATQEFDIGIDADNDGADDYVVISFDIGRLLTGTFDGRYGTFVLNLHSGVLSFTGFSVFAPTDGSTALIPLFSTSLCTGGGAPCLNAANPRFTYDAAGFDITSDFADFVPGTAKYNAWASSISQGDFQVVAVGQTTTSAVAINPAEWALTPALGVMVVTHDNKAGKDEAALLPLELK
jgi:hypothetical protein